MKKGLSAFLALLLLVGIPVNVYAADPAARTVVISKIEGSTVTMTKGTAKEYKAKEGQKLSNGYTVSTGTGSYCYLELDSASTVKMDQKSKIQLNKVSSKKLAVAVQSGALLVNAAPQGQEQEFEVSAGNSSMAIRGTSFTVSYSDNGTFTIVMLSGSGSVGGVMIEAGHVMEIKDGVSEEGFKELAISEDMDLFVLEAIQENAQELVEKGIITQDESVKVAQVVEQKQQEQQVQQEQQEQQQEQKAAEENKESKPNNNSGGSSGGTRPTPVDTTVAKIGSTTFASINAAINAASSGQTIEVVSNAGITTAASLSSGATIEIPNERTLTVEGNTKIYGTIKVINGGNLIVKANTTLEVYTGGVIDNRGNVQNGGTIIMEGNSSMTNNGIIHNTGTYKMNGGKYFGKGRVTGEIGAVFDYIDGSFAEGVTDGAVRFFTATSSQGDNIQGIYPIAGMAYGWTNEKGGGWLSVQSSFYSAIVFGGTMYVYLNTLSQALSGVGYTVVWLENDLVMTEDLVISGNKIFNSNDYKVAFLGRVTGSGDGVRILINPSSKFYVKPENFPIDNSTVFESDGSLSSGAYTWNNTTQKWEEFVSVAKIGTTEYTSVEEALADASYADTIEITNDTTVTGNSTILSDTTLFVPSGKKLTFLLRSNSEVHVHGTLDNEGELVATQASSIQIHSGGEVINQGDISATSLKGNTGATFKYNSGTLLGYAFENKFKDYYGVIISSPAYGEYAWDLDSWKAVDHTSVAEIDGSLYETIDEAIVAAISGKTINLIRDAAIAQGTTGTIKTGVTLNVPAGKSLTVSENSKLDVLGTLKVQGTLSLKASAELLTGTSSEVLLETLDAQVGATFNHGGGTLVGSAVTAMQLKNYSGGIESVIKQGEYEKKADGYWQATSTSAVAIVGTGTEVVEFSSISEALQTAVSGEIRLLTDTAILESPISLSAGVSLVVPAGMILTIEDGMNLTVEGFMNVQGTLYMTKFARITMKAGCTVSLETLVADFDTDGPAIDYRGGVLDGIAVGGMTFKDHNGVIQPSIRIGEYEYMDNGVWQATESTAVATIGTGMATIEYETVEGALAAAVTGNTIQVITHASITAAATVPNGVTLSVPSGITLSVSAAATLIVSSDAVVENNGTLHNAGTLAFNGIYLGDGQLTGAPGSVINYINGSFAEGITNGAIRFYVKNAFQTADKIEGIYPLNNMQYEWMEDVNGTGWMATINAQIESLPVAFKGTEVLSPFYTLADALADTNYLGPIGMNTGLLIAYDVQIPQNGTLNVVEYPITCLGTVTGGYDAKIYIHPYVKFYVDPENFETENSSVFQEDGSLVPDTYFWNNIEEKWVLPSVAEVAGNTYTTLKAALDAAVSGDEITLLQNVIVAGTESLIVQANTTLNLNANNLTLDSQASLTVEGTLVINSGEMLEILEDGELIISLQGDVDVQGNIVNSGQILNAGGFVQGGSYSGNGQLIGQGNAQLLTQIGSSFEGCITNGAIKFFVKDSTNNRQGIYPIEESAYVWMEDNSDLGWMTTSENFFVAFMEDEYGDTTHFNTLVKALDDAEQSPVGIGRQVSLDADLVISSDLEIPTGVTLELNDFNIACLGKITGQTGSIIQTESNGRLYVTSENFAIDDATAFNADGSLGAGRYIWDSWSSKWEKIQVVAKIATGASIVEYTTLGDALVAAVSGDVIQMIQSAQLAGSGSYQLPADVSLLVPADTILTFAGVELVIQGTASFASGSDIIIDDGATVAVSPGGSIENQGITVNYGIIKNNGTIHNDGVLRLYAGQYFGNGQLTGKDGTSIDCGYTSFEDSITNGAIRFYLKNILSTGDKIEGIYPLSNMTYTWTDDPGIRGWMTTVGDETANIPVALKETDDFLPFYTLADALANINDSESIGVSTGLLTANNVQIPQGGTLNIVEYPLTCLGTVTGAYGAKIYIGLEGKFYVDPQNFEISDSSVFREDGSLVPNTYIWKDADAEWEPLPRAAIGGYNYTTLEGALNAAVSGDEITLLQNVVVDETESLIVQANTTLNLNTYNVTLDPLASLTVEGTLEIGSGETLEILKDGKLTISSAGEAYITGDLINAGDVFSLGNIYNTGDIMNAGTFRLGGSYFGNGQLIGEPGAILETQGASFEGGITNGALRFYVQSGEKWEVECTYPRQTGVYRWPDDTYPLGWIIEDPDFVAAYISGDDGHRESRKFFVDATRDADHGKTVYLAADLVILEDLEFYFDGVTLDSDIYSIVFTGNVTERDNTRLIVQHDGKVFVNTAFFQVEVDEMGAQIEFNNDGSIKQGEYIYNSHTECWRNLRLPI